MIYLELDDVLAIACEVLGLEAAAVVPRHCWGILEAVPAAAAECADLDEAEVWASSAQVLFGPVGLAGPTVLPASRALAAAEACSDRGAAVVAASISAYGPPRDRRRAARLLERLAENDEPLPRWIGALGDVTPHRAALLTDDWGDERSVWIDFERSDGEVRGLGVSVNGSQGAYACHFVYGPSIAAIEGPFARQPHTVMRPLGLAEARAMIEAALARRDQSDLDYDGDDGLDHELRALVDQRVALLPDGGTRQPGSPTDEEIDGLCEEFVAVAGEAMPDEAESVASTVCRFAYAWCDGDPLCWSPPRVEHFLSVWIPAKSVCDDEWHDVVEWVFPLWLRFAAQRRGLAAELLELNLEAARESFAYMRTNAADPAMRSPTTNIVTEMLDDGIDITDEATVQETLPGALVSPKRSQGACWTLPSKYSVRAASRRPGSLRSVDGVRALWAWWAAGWVPEPRQREILC